MKTNTFMGTSRHAFGVLALSAVAVLGAPASTAWAAEEFDVTVVSGFPPVVSGVKFLKETFMPGVDARLAKTGNYKVNWQEAFSGTLAKPGGELEAVQTGLAEVGLMITALYGDKAPLYKIGYVTPFTTSDLVLVHKVVDQLAEKYPAFAEGWAQFNQVSLSASGIADNYVMCSSTPVKSIKDLNGLKVGGIGPNLRWVEPLGATGVTGTLANFYQMMETGVMDSMLIWGEAIVSLKFYEVCKNYFNADLGGANTYAINVNMQAWEGYPDEVKTAMKEAAADYGVALGKHAEALGKKALEAFRQNGGTIVQIDPTERREWATTLPNLAQEWANELESQGIPGKAILADYMQAMRDAKQPIARQWDKE